MTWPNSQTTTSLDADTDTLQNARPEVKGLADKFNQLVAHVTTFMQGLLSSADAATARNTLDVPSKNGAGATGIWGIAVSGSAATAATATNCGRAVQGSGLATGGGVLNTDQIISVTASTQAEAEAGTDNATAMTPLRTAQAISVLSKAIGVGQTWQVMTSSRASSTPYQNTTGRPILVSVTSNSASGESFQVSENGTAWLTVGRYGREVTASFVIPAGWYYKSLSGFTIWTELR